MRKLTDKDVSLDWQIYSAKEIAKTTISNKRLHNLLNILNSWDSDNINNFITYTPQIKLGNFICQNLTSNYQLRNDNAKYFYLMTAHEKDEIVGIIILNTNSNDITNDFNLNTDENNLRIEYIVVNPEKQNMGIGTRMIKSVINNQKTLCTTKNLSGITTDIDNENIVSSKAFLKNKFKIVMPASYISKYFSRYYFTSKSPNKNKEL